MVAKTAHKKSIRAGSSFELFAPIPSRSICEMLANFFGVEFKSRLYPSSRQEKLIFSLCSRPSYNVKLGSFTPYLCNNGKEIYKKRRSTLKGVVLLIGNLRTTTTTLSTTTRSEIPCTAQARLTNFVVVVSSTTPNTVESRRPAVHKLRQV